MRNIVNYEIIKKNNNFWIWFIMNNFPESLDELSDKTVMEIINENYFIDKEWIDEFTGYYKEVFNENDGYIENPNTLEIILSTNDILYIEFHPGDTIYYINDIEIGCTGPEYSIKKISWKEYCNYTYLMDNKKKLLLLPMLSIEKNSEYSIIDILGCVIKEDILENVYNAIIENCII